MKRIAYLSIAIVAMILTPIGSALAQDLRDKEIENIVRRSWQYVAMYNVNNKFAMDPDNPMSTGGWNRVRAHTTLVDHTLKAIARPNNDTLYIGALLDLTNEPIILETPTIDSKYVSLMVTGYDHFVNIPMSTRQGDFSKPSRILFYTERTKGYKGEPVQGVDKIAKMTGDFVSAVHRVMPHAAEPKRLQRNLDAMRNVKVLTLSEYRSGIKQKTRFVPWSSPSGKSPDLEAREDALEFPDFGKTDFDIFENNLLEVMQFVFNHTTFDPDDELDRQLLAAYKPLGVVPGRPFDPAKVAKIDGARFRQVAEEIAPREMAKANDPKFLEENFYDLFRPKGQMTLERLLFQSIIGPIGLPAAEAVYPPITTTDGMQMNAMNDYVIRMKKKELPPATAFWSATLYDTENGFFIPNERKKYSVGENGGMKLDVDGGIAIYIGAERPEGVPGENWLPLKRGDYGVDVIMRIYAPDLERFKRWKAPKAEKL